MTGSMLDVLIYLFDRYMLEAGPGPAVPERAQLTVDLTRAGFKHASVERALDWLTELAWQQDRTQGDAARAAGLRVFTDSELVRLSSECRGLLLRLERAGILDAQQREIVIERLLALDAEEPDTEQLKWVVFMVLSSQPGQAPAYERLEGLTSAARGHAPH
jgi:Smg protein